MCWVFVLSGFHVCKVLWRARAPAFSSTTIVFRTASQKPRARLQQPARRSFDTPPPALQSSVERGARHPEIVAVLVALRKRPRARIHTNPPPARRNTDRRTIEACRSRRACGAERRNGKGYRWVRGGRKRSARTSFYRSCVTARPGHGGRRTAHRAGAHMGRVARPRWARHRSGSTTIGASFFLCFCTLRRAGVACVPTECTRLGRPRT